MTGGAGVLLLHGYGRTGASMSRLAAAARGAGHATLSPSYPARRPLAEIVGRLAPRVAAFEAELDGPVHIVTHSMGGLVARALIAARRPRALGRVVMLAPPSAGSEWADLLLRLRLAPLFLGRSAQHLRTRRGAAEQALLGLVDYPLGVIAGDRALVPPWLVPLPRPNDGKVSLAATHVEGEADHIVLPVGHTRMLHDRRAIATTFDFLETGHFTRSGAR